MSYIKNKLATNILQSVTTFFPLVTSWFQTNFYFRALLLHGWMSFVCSASYKCQCTCTLYLCVLFNVQPSSCLCVLFFLFSILLHVVPYNPQDITRVHCSSKKCTWDCYKHLGCNWCWSVPLQVRIPVWTQMNLTVVNLVTGISI